MPLNIEDSEEKNGPPPADRPASHETKGVSSGSGRGTKILLWILLAIVIGSLVFLLIQFGVIPPKEDGTAIAPPPPTEEKIREEPAGDTAAAAPTVVSRDSLRRAELRARLMMGGRYTIYISAYRLESDADEHALRWVDGGYPAFVQRSDGWFRVALGRYESGEDARAEAEKLKQAFEEGYWIGTVDIP